MKKSYYLRNREKCLENARRRYLEKKEEIKEYHRQYNKTPYGRALNLVSTYNQSDKKYGRGECTLTADWVVENIFSKQCSCGESDWHKLGCNRINNDLPHTPDNVEPCCTECNKKRVRSKHTRKITD